MIQAPQTQYIPGTVPVQDINQQPQGAIYPQQNYSVPNPIYSYPQANYYPALQPVNYAQQPYSSAGKSQYNGVNIEIINPQGAATPNGVTPYGYQQPIVPQYPQQYPAANYYVSQQPVMVQPQPMVPQYPVNNYNPEQPVYIQPEPANTQPAVNNEQPFQPQVTQQPQAVQPQVVQPQPAVQTPPPVIEQPASSVDGNALVQEFTGRLKTDDLDSQRLAIEDLAEKVKNDESVADILLDSQIYDSLTEIINKDTSNLEAPSPEVVELRKKPEQELTEAEKVLAHTETPLEKAENNKKYALYTIAYMDERLNNQLVSQGNSALELYQLPCIDTVVNTVKDNPNFSLRSAGIASLLQISRPEYKDDLTTIFNIARTDEDDRVKSTAETALTNLGVDIDKLELPSDNKEADTSNKKHKKAKKAA